MRALTQAVGAEAMALMKERGVRYSRTLPCREDGRRMGNYYSWEASFGTSDHDEAIMRQRGYEWEWKNDRRTLTYRWRRPGVAPDPSDPSRDLFFNQLVVLHHSYYLDYPRAVELGRVLTDPDDWPSNTAWGDGEPIDQEFVDFVRAETWKCTVGVSWQKGDLVFLNNMLVAHGRMGFNPTSKRKIMVSLTKD